MLEIDINNPRIFFSVPNSQQGTKASHPRARDNDQRVPILLLLLLLLLPPTSPQDDVGLGVSLTAEIDARTRVMYLLNESYVQRLTDSNIFLQ